MLGATLLALGSAFLHAGWNLSIKTSDDRAVAAWGQMMAGALVAAAGLAFVGLPGWAAVPYLALSTVVHLAYVEALVAAYTHGDFSLSYPLARGGGAVLAAVASAVVLDDRLPLLGWAAIAVAGAGLVGLRGPGRADRTATGFALLTAATIATYTIVDSAGSRAGSSGVQYGLAAAAATGVVIGLANLARPSRRARAGALRAGWKRSLVGGVASLVAYTMVLVAVRRAPVGYVTMLRESSVVIGALVGWRVLGEALGRRRLIASGVILTGLVLLVAASR